MAEEKTPWFAPGTNPAYVGVYEASYEAEAGWFRVWDGRYWYTCARTPDEALSMYQTRVLAAKQAPMSWRGLTRPTVPAPTPTPKSTPREFALEETLRAAVRSLDTIGSWRNGDSQVMANFAAVCARNARGVLQGVAITPPSAPPAPPPAPKPEPQIVYEGRAFGHILWQPWEPVSRDVYEARQKKPRGDYQVRRREIQPGTAAVPNCSSRLKGVFWGPCDCGLQPGHAR